MRAAGQVNEFRNVGNKWKVGTEGKRERGGGEVKELKK